MVNVCVCNENMFRLIEVLRPSIQHHIQRSDVESRSISAPGVAAYLPWRAWNLFLSFPEELFNA